MYNSLTAWGGQIELKKIKTSLFLEFSICL
jgi:hypothetical protein